MDQVGRPGHRCVRPRRGVRRRRSGLWVEPPDTIRVWDSRNPRVTTWRADGSLVGTRRVYPDAPGAPGGRLTVAAGQFSDGDLALGYYLGGPPRGDRITPDRVILARFGHDGRLEKILGEGEGIHRSGGHPVAFSPYAYTTVHRDTVYFTSGEGSRVVVRDGRGDVCRTLRLPPSPVGASEAWPALAETLRHRGQEATLRYLRALPRPEETPGLAGMFLDASGRVWAKAYDPAEDPIQVAPRPWAPGGLWWVVSRRGEPLAKIEMPGDVAPLDVRRDRLLGLRRGPLGEEKIVVHRILR